MEVMVEDRVNAKITEILPQIREEVKAELLAESQLEQKFQEEKESMDLKVEEVKTHIEKLEELGKITFAKNCQDLFDQGVEVSGFYFTDPDGQGLGQPPIQVYCDVTKQTTEVTHDKEETIEMDACDDRPGCSTYEVNYEGSMDQINQLIDQSESCTQKIWFDCRFAPLNQDGQAFGWFLDKAGQAKDIATCKCANGDESCIDENCNCDAHAYQDSWQSDEIEVTDKDLLPIKGFQYGPIGAGLLGPNAKFSVGRLTCSGSKNSLKIESKLIEDDNLISKVSRVEGSLDALTNDSRRLQTSVQQLENIQSKKVVFNAIRHMGGNFVGDITYNSIPTNVGNAMDPSTGVFKSPYNATYFFTLSGVSPDNEPKAIIRYVKNGEVSSNHFYLDKGGEYFQILSYQWMLELNTGDEVNLRVFNGYDFFASSTFPVIFTGQLVTLAA